MPSVTSRRILPGFTLSLSTAILYLAVLLALPLAALIWKVSSLTPAAFFKVVWSERARAAYAVTFGCSLGAAAVDVVLGLLLAWILVRYNFVGKRLLDSLIDLPLALPTAVAGLVYSNLFFETGWYGRFLCPVGIHGAYTQLAIVLVLSFIGLPFAVRAVQPVLETLDPETEEAAACMGASRWQTFRFVIFPALMPALLTGFALSFARGIGEYGSVVFVSGNKPFKTEIAPLLIVAKLEEANYAEAAAIATVLLVASLATLAVINVLERRSRIHDV